MLKGIADKLDLLISLMRKLSMSYEHLIEFLGRLAQGSFGGLTGYLVKVMLERAQRRRDALRSRPLQTQTRNRPSLVRRFESQVEFSNENLEELLSDFCEEYEAYYGQSPTSIQLDVSIDILRSRLGITMTYWTLTIQSFILADELADERDMEN